MVLVCSRSFWDEFQVNNSRWVEKQYKHHLAFWPILLRFLLSWWWWRFQVADCCITCRLYRKHHVASPVMIWLRNIPSLSALLIKAPQVLMCQDTHNTVLGNTRHVQVVRQNPVASCCCCCPCRFIHCLGVVGMHKCSSFLDLEFNSNHSWPFPPTCTCAPPRTHAHSRAQKKTVPLCNQSTKWLTVLHIWVSS